ncbi:MAG: primosomal protein N' [bacterium]
MFAQIVINVPLDRAFTYRIPDQLLQKAAVGKRVLVPFRNRRVIGYIVAVTARADLTGIRDVKEILEVLDDAPFISTALLRLTKWIADYYLASWGSVISGSLPAGIGFKERSIPVKKAKFVRLIAQSPELEEFLHIQGKKAPRQAAVILALQEQEFSLAALLKSTGANRNSLQCLAQRNLIEIYEREIFRDPLIFQDETAKKEIIPNKDQQKAIQVIKSALDREEFSPFLLHGVTGSGKTHVYLQAVSHALAMGKTALVMVPEISLTHQLVNRFHNLFGNRIAVLHSGLGKGERIDEWRRVLSQEATVAIGARSAIFAPLQKLGLVILDEEHETSYKQDNSPRYHARDVALMRAKMANALLLLGSATPSLESFHAARGGLFGHLTLPDRATTHPLPKIQLVDMKTEIRREEPKQIQESKQIRESKQAQGAKQIQESRQIQGAKAIQRWTPGKNPGGTPGGTPQGGTPQGKAEGNPYGPRGGKTGGNTRPLFSRVLIEAIERRIRQKEQAILFINRRGFSNFLLCCDCGHVPKCRNCSVSLTYHAYEGRLRCHYCNFVSPAPHLCPACRKGKLQYIGFGTQKVEEEARCLFPSARIERMDQDTVTRKTSHQKILSRLANGEIDILIGTQMIAKGLDFPKVTLVGVVAADSILNLPDFRSAERTFQLITQVAGRAGRGEIQGEVIVQTFSPSHYSLQCASRMNYRAFYEQEILYRQELGYPPFSRMINIIIKGGDINVLKAAATRLMNLLVSLKPDEVSILGPAQAPIFKIRGQYRFQILLKSSQSLALNDLIRKGIIEFQAGFTGEGIQLDIDVDPVNLM